MVQLSCQYMTTGNTTALILSAKVMSLLFNMLSGFVIAFLPRSKGKVAQSCLTLWPNTARGILQARTLEWVAYPFSRGSTRPRDRTGVSCIAGRFFTNRAIREALPRSKHLLILWLQTPSTGILEPKKGKSVTASPFPPSIFHEVMGSDAVILVFWMLSFKPAFSISSFTLNKRLFSSSSLSDIKVV